MNEPSITMQHESVLLHILSHLHAGPFYCWRCRVQISADTKWKPLVCLLTNGPDEVRGAQIVLLCGSCNTLLAADPALHDLRQLNSWLTELMGSGLVP